MNDRGNDGGSPKAKPAASPLKTVLGVFSPGGGARKPAKTLVAPLPENIDFFNTVRGSQLEPSNVRALPKELPAQFALSVFPNDSDVVEANGPPGESGVVAVGNDAEEAPPPSYASGELRHIQHYEIVKKLGEGGMGVVYLARDTRLGRRVAIKVLRTRDPEITRRFIIEARTTARCTHENIVVIHDAGEFEGSPYMVLEFLEGRTLTDYIQQESPSVTRCVEIVVSVVSALARAHSE
ncbi:MAG TPA: serine/threonine-protein kinase, partial [Polyangiaceae bacterium]|nr:serine/threonine-protein kinase [Polyangiaceae bacterium]